MPLIGERITVKNIREALGRLKQIRGARVIKQLGPGEILAAGTVLTIRSFPTLEEIRLLPCQGASLCLQFKTEGGLPALELTPGGRDDTIIPDFSDRGAIVLTFDLSDPAALFSKYSPGSSLNWGLPDLWHILTPNFVFRLENLPSEAGSTETVNKDGSFYLRTMVFRPNLPGPFIREFPYRGSEQYESPAAFYSQVISAIADKGFSTSFAISGLPRICAATARARMYFFTWEDFTVMLNELYRGDTFRVFNSRDSWLNFFAR